MPCKIAARTTPRERQVISPKSCRLRLRLLRLHSARNQPQQVRSQCRKLRALRSILRMYDDVPSRRYLHPVTTHDLSQPPPDAIAHYRAAESSLDAEAEAALRQIVRFRENGEVGIGTALPMTVNRVEVRLAHEAHGRRIRQPGSIRA